MVMIHVPVNSSLSWESSWGTRYMYMYVSVQVGCQIKHIMKVALAPYIAYGNLAKATYMYTCTYIIIHVQYMYIIILSDIQTIHHIFICWRSLFIAMHMLIRTQMHNILWSIHGMQYMQQPQFKCRRAQCICSTKQLLHGPLCES